jgi:hypothetical protein
MLPNVEAALAAGLTDTFNAAVSPRNQAAALSEGGGVRLPASNET